MDVLECFKKSILANGGNIFKVGCLPLGPLEALNIPLGPPISETLATTEGFTVSRVCLFQLHFGFYTFQNYPSAYLRE